MRDQRRAVVAGSFSVMLAKINFATDADVEGAEPYDAVTLVGSGETLRIRGEPVHLIDLRYLLHHAHICSLDVDGFELVQLPYDVDGLDAVGAEGWEQEYCEKMTLWLRDHLNVCQAVYMGHVIRRRMLGSTLSALEQMGTKAAAQPAYAAHVDLSTANGAKRCRDAFPELGPQTTRRCAFFNVWRPLRGPVVDAPLAVCDSRTLSLEDLFETTDKFGGGYYIRHNPKQKWYYVSNQMPHEMLVFRSYDSHVMPGDGTAFGTAHAAFINEDRARESMAPPRQSIEVRIAVLH